MQRQQDPAHAIIYTDDQRGQRLATGSFLLNQTSSKFYSDVVGERVVRGRRMFAVATRGEDGVELCRTELELEVGSINGEEFEVLLEEVVDQNNNRFINVYKKDGARKQHTLRNFNLQSTLPQISEQVEAEGARVAEDGRKRLQSVAQGIENLRSVTVISNYYKNLLANLDIDDDNPRNQSPA